MKLVRIKARYSPGVRFTAVTGAEYVAVDGLLHRVQDGVVAPGAGVADADADKMLQHSVYYGAMMVNASRADGMVAGSICPTADSGFSSEIDRPCSFTRFCAAGTGPDVHREGLDALQSR